VRCAPPANRPTPQERDNCGGYLASEIGAMANLAGILALGQIAHNAVLASFGLVRSRYPFAHGALHDLGNGRTLSDSYHCSRLNTNTGRLTTPMFEDLFARVKAYLDETP